MNAQNILVGVLVLTNVGFMESQFVHPRAEQAATIAPVLRSRALELVDDQGRIRAEIKVTPAQPSVTMPDGPTGYPEAVVLRLINSQNGPDLTLN
jgi:hypothetical protein